MRIICLSKLFLIFILCVITDSYRLNVKPSLSPFRKSFRSQSSTLHFGEEPRKIVFLGNLPLRDTSEEVNALAKSKGISGYSVRLAIDRKGKYRGFCYLDFDTPEEAVRASQLLIGSKIGKREINVDLDAGIDTPTHGRRASVFKDNHTIFIGNLPYETTKDDIEQLIQDVVGKVTMRVELAVGYGRRFKGFCHVDFTNARVVSDVIYKLHDTEFQGRVINVEKALPTFKYSEPSADRDDSDRDNEYMKRDKIKSKKMMSSLYQESQQQTEKPIGRSRSKQYNSRSYRTGYNSGISHSRPTYFDDNGA